MPNGRFDDDFDNAFDDWGGVADEDHSGLSALDAYTAADADAGTIPTLMFTAGNPRQTVSVTALLGGRVHQLELSPSAVEMTETELAREILEIARLASRQGQAGAHALIAAALGRSGADSAAIRGHLEREIGLPSPDTVRAQRAEFFAARYAEDRD